MFADVKTGSGTPVLLQNKKRRGSKQESVESQYRQSRSEPLHQACYRTVKVWSTAWRQL